MALSFNTAAPDPTAANPIRAALSASPEGAALYKRIDIPASDLHSSFQRVGHILTSLWAKVAQLEANKDYKPTVIAQQIANARSSALQALDSEYADDEQRRQAILDVCEAAIAAAIAAPPAKDPQAALLFESQLSRAWQRATRVLDAAPNGRLVAVAQDLVKAAAESKDAPSVEAFRQELPAYMAAKGAAMNADWIASLMRPYLSPVGRAATAGLEELARGWSSLEACFWIARRYASDSTNEKISALPGWSGRHDVQLETKI